MTFKLHTTTTDDFNDVGNGKRENSEIWYRSDTKEIKAMLDGEIVTLFKKSGGPATVDDLQIKPGGKEAHRTKLLQLRTELTSAGNLQTLRTALTDILDYLLTA